jgi:hypothetical protein
MSTWHTEPKEHLYPMAASATPAYPCWAPRESASSPWTGVFDHDWAWWAGGRADGHHYESVHSHGGDYISPRTRNQTGNQAETTKFTYLFGERFNSNSTGRRFRLDRTRIRRIGATVRSTIHISIADGWRYKIEPCDIHDSNWQSRLLMQSRFLYSCQGLGDAAKEHVL